MFDKKWLTWEYLSSRFNKWADWSYIKGRLKDAGYAIGVVTIGWLGFKTATGVSADILAKAVMPKEYKICITGDTGTGGDKQKLVASFLKKEGCDELRILGDVVYSHGLKDENDPLFHSRFWDIYKDLNIPVFVVMGNHDNRRNIGAWIKLAEKYENVKFPYYYYGENYGGEVCFLSLNSTTFTMLVKSKHEKKQDEFVKDFLEQSKDNCKLSVSLAHHALISYGSHGDAGGRIKKFYSKLLLGKIDVILAGHDHDMSYDGTVEGTHNIVSGAGGKLRIPSKYEDRDLSGPLDTDRGWINFNLGYHVMIYKGDGNAIFIEKYIRDGKLITNDKVIEVNGKGIR